MTVKTDIEDETDETADKAAAIGKELGVEDKDNDVPEYEITEESDERIAKERQPRVEKKERPQLSNKEKRDLRKKRIAEKFSEKDSIIQSQQQKIDELSRWKNEVDGRLSGINRAEIDKAYNETLAQFSEAERKHTEAFTEGDAAKATASMRTMYDAQRKIEQLQLLKAQVEQKPAPIQNEAPQVDSAVVNKAKEWAARHSWYNPNGKDVDSEIAKAISGVLANEGYDPKTDDFWDELDDRLAERLPEKYAESSDDDEEDEPAPKPAKKRSAPPVAGGSARGESRGKVSITLPTAFINTLKDNGIWDDKPKRDRIIKNYLDGQKAQRV